MARLDRRGGGRKDALMPERDARRGRFFWILLALGLVAAVAGIAVLMALARSRSGSSGWLALPDGSVVRVFGVTYGTNHVIGNPLTRLASEMPAGVQSVLAGLFGPRAIRNQTLSTPFPTLVVWLDPKSSVSVVLPSYSGYIDAYLGDMAGFVSGASENRQQVATVGLTDNGPAGM